MGFHLSKFVQSKAGRSIMSMLLGLGLSTLFRSVCQGNNCYEFNAAPLEDYNKKIFKNDGKCYKLKMNATKCDKSKKIISYS